MISFSGLLGDITSYGDKLRYRRGAWPQRKPIVVWNCTRRCNLACAHCYSDSRDQAYPGELTTDEARQMIRGLKEYEVPVLLFSGGEPLLRADLFELNRYARERGLRTVISTNGTLITPEMARKIKAEGFEYVGISLDGVGRNNDRFRGKAGAYDAALSGIRALIAAGQKVGLRYTFTRQNLADLPALLKLVEAEKIDRVCFYHLAYAGRGHAIQEADLAHEQTRGAIDSIYAWTRSLIAQGRRTEVLTVDNHADGACLYLKLRQDDPARAATALELMTSNGGNASGVGIADIDAQGHVHPDQFWQNVSFGNVRQRPFGEIWQDPGQELLMKLKDRRPHLKGRCRRCRFLGLCNGNLRARAWAVNGDVWTDDPACYLTEKEIA